MPILVISVNLECCRSKAKIQMILGCLQEKYCIEKIEYDEKINKVIVRGKFDAQKLYQKIWCKACDVVTEIKIVEVWPPPPPEPECKLVLLPCPLPCQCSPWQCPPQQCPCCAKPPPPEKCNCGKCDCGKPPQCPPIWPPWCPPCWVVVREDKPSE